MVFLIVQKMNESRKKRRIRHFLKKVFKTLTLKYYLKNKMAQNTIEYDNITDIDDIDVTDEYKQLQDDVKTYKRNNTRLQEKNTELKEKMNNFEFYKKLFYFFAILFIISIFLFVFQYQYLNNYYRGEILKNIEGERELQNKNLDTVIGLINSLRRPPVLQF